MWSCRSKQWSEGRVAFFFFNDTPTTGIYTLSLPDALPISSLIYLVGVHYNGVAFSQRVGFAPGRRELAVVLRIFDPADDTSAVTTPVRLALTVIRLAWPGAGIVVREDQIGRAHV